MSTRLTPVRMHGHVEFVRIEVASSGGGGGFQWPKVHIIVGLSSAVDTSAWIGFR